MIDYNKINTFIYKVFNYYNGKINTFCKANLFIEWVSKSLIVGTTRNPNVITIYPMSAIKYANNEYELYYILLESVIHELYHIDQIIDFPRMMLDKYYMAQIECAVESETNIYLANHRQEIYEQFGINVYMNSKLISNIDKFSLSRYHRKRLSDHIIGILREINSSLNFKIDINTLSKKIIDLLNNNGIIYIILNNKSIINFNNYCCNIDINNKILYDEYFKYEIPNPLEISVNEIDTLMNKKILNISIYYIPKRKMISYL